MQGRDAEELVARWLRAAGFVPERFPRRHRLVAKAPDFRVTGPLGCFLLEVKTLTRTARGHGAVAFKLARARGQFDAVNRGGRLANVLALVTASSPGVALTLEGLAAPAALHLDVIDLVLGFAPSGAPPRVLHKRLFPRHARLTAAIEAATTMIPEEP